MTKKQPQSKSNAGLSVRILNWPRTQLRQMYNWMMRWGDSPQAELALFGFAFSESSFFPIPPDPLLIAMITANSRKWIRLIIITTIASVAGALLGYFIGFGLFESLGQPIINTYNLQAEFTTIGLKFQENTFLTIFTAGFTPIPFKVFTIAGGLFRINIITLIIASLLSRGARFLIVGFLAHKLGAKYKDQIEKYIDIIGIAFIVVLGLGFIAVKYLF